MVDPVLTAALAASGNTTNLANTGLTTNFNVTPYYDDYDPNNQYYRILYKPGYAVQARELTQMQSMLQSQIYRLGRHIFKEGSIVLPGGFRVRSNLGEKKGDPIDYVKINNLDTSNTVVNVNDLLGATIRGATSNIMAYVIDVADTDGTTQNTKTLYVNYLSASSANSAWRTFRDGESITSPNTSGAVVVDSGSTGYAAWFQIQEGVYFAKEHFIYFPTQSVVLDRYNPNPNCKVGFIVSEDIVNYTQDSNLLDPALEASNFSAPGADRLRLASTLSVVDYDSTDGFPDFVTLFTIKNGIIQVSNEKTDYNILGDYIADRTSQESGDYVVKGMNVQVQEHDRVETPINNQGRFANGNNQQLIVNVDPGTAFVKGYQVSNQDIVTMVIDKPEDYMNVAQQISSATMGQYFKVNEFVGTWEADQSNRINFYDVLQRRIRNNGLTAGTKWSTGAQTGNLIGSAIVNSVQYSGQGTPGYDAVYNIYVSDIRMLGSNTVSKIKSLYYDLASTPDSGADIYGATDLSANTILQEYNTGGPLLYYVGSTATKTTRDVNGSAKTLFNFNRTSGVSSTLSFNTGGTTTITLAPGNIIFPYGAAATVGTTDKDQDLIVTMAQTFNIGPLWSSSITGNGTNYIISSNSQFTKLNLGDKIEIAGQGANTWYITGITDDTHMTLSNVVPASVSSNLIFKAYKTGDIIDLAGKGVTTGTERTVTATTTTLQINLQETLPSSQTATVNYVVASKLSQEKAKDLNPHVFVKIAVGSNTNGPYCLGIPDVYQIRNIVLKSGGYPSTLTDGTNVTRYFTLDSGQKDTYYDLAYIKKSPGLSLTGSSYLLVELDCFVENRSSGFSYYSVDSYPIQDNDAIATEANIRTENIPIFVSPTTRNKYDLRNHLDFRPVKVATANVSATTIATATQNPSSNSNTFSFTGGTGLRFPVPSSEIVFDYSYYLSRKDAVIATKDNTFAVVKGQPAVSPIVPDTTDNNMLLAVISLPPYPCISPSYGNALGRQDLACSIQKYSNRRYTMRDIGTLENRIKNLEYYVSLTMLEKNALALQIPDEVGMDRFKNGIFIDTFKDSSLSAKGVNPDFRAVFDPNELSIVPLFTQESFKHEYLSGSTTGTPVVVQNNIVTLSYSSTSQFSQPKVTDSRLLERGTFSFKGLLTLLPTQDLWVDTTYAPDEVIKIDANNSTMNISVSNSSNGYTDSVDAKITKSLLNTEWESWKQHITGYKVYKGQGASKVLYGSYATEAEAKTAAKSWTTVYGKGVASLETVYFNERVGTNYYANYSTDDAAGSYKMISSTKIPYIRPQSIYVWGTGLKPYSKLNAFFDGINVSAYCRPLTVDQYIKYTSGEPPLMGAVISPYGDPLIVDTIGRVFFEFAITKNGPKFRTGDRKLLVLDGEQIDPQQISDEVDASTIASGIFVADGSAQTLQRTVYSTTGYQRSFGPAYEKTESLSSYAVLPNTGAPPKYSHCCFNPEAKVLMADKTWKAIQDIIEGDEVVGDNGQVNTVKKINTPLIENRKMVKLKSIDGTTFYSTDDHLFMTDKGWKTWDTEYVKKSYDDGHKVDFIFLEGENKTCSIDHSDKLKVVKADNLSEYDFIPYEGEVGMHGYTSKDVVYDLTLDGNMSYIVEGHVVHNCCVAYVVFIKAPDDEEGIFVTSMDVFVQRKSPTRGMWFEIREVDKGGGITPTRIPGSAVYYPNDQIIVSPNGRDMPTNVVFPRPVFLFKDTNYAFILHSESPSALDVDPDTAIWISRLGETDKNTLQKVTDRQATGTFYQTLNNQTWDIIKDLDLTCNIYRAKFTKDSTANFIISNEPVERMFLANVSTSLSGTEGSWYTTGDIITITTPVGTSGIAVGDRATGNISTSNANGNVINVISATQFYSSNTLYRIGERIDFFYSTNNTIRCTANVTAISNSTAKLSYYNESASSIVAEFTGSSGGFVPGMIIQNMTEGPMYRAQIKSMTDLAYGAFSYEPTVLDFVKTNLQYEMLTYANNSTTASPYQYINPSETTYFSEEKSLYSRSSELTKLSGNQSNKIKVTLTTTSEYVAPVYDLASSHNIYLDSIINSDYAGEDGKSGGNAIDKYISQVITLADGQDAEDLNVYLTAYRPPGTDVKVYVKLLHSDDGEPFSEKYWIEMPKDGTGDAMYSSLVDRNNFREYIYKLPSSIMTGQYGQVQYSSNGINYTGYKYFAVKILLLGDNSAVYPRVADLRCVALQM